MSESTESKTPNVSAQESKRTVTAKVNLNLRTGPSFKAEVVKVVEGGTKLTVLNEETDGWLKVAGGYVFAENVI